MKKYFYTTLFALIFPIFVIGAYLAVLPAQSVNAQGTCNITSLVIRTTKPGGPGAEGFYISSNPPFVYLDISTTDCIGQIVELNIYDIGTVVNTDVDAFDNLPISIGSMTGDEDNFTLVARAGEENCSWGSGPDCEFGIEILNASTDNVIYTYPQEFLYDCEGSFPAACSDGTNWQFVDIIPLGNDLGGTGGIDQYGPGVTAGNVTTTPPPTTSDTPGGPSIIDLSIPNPLAGTVGTIPEFFHMAVDFVITIGIPLVAMAIVYSGFLFVTARGSDEQLSHAKEALTYAIIGGLVLLAAWLVAGAIKDALLSI